MRDGISGVPLPDGFPYKDIIDPLGVSNNVAPCLVGAIKMNETGLNAIDDQLQDGCNAATGLLPDGTNCGRGPMQLTSSFPSDWADPQANFRYAIQAFILPAWQYWAGQGLQGGDLVRCIAASYNAGLGAAIEAHAKGDVDAATYSGHYGADAQAHYTALAGGTIP